MYKLAVFDMDGTLLDTLDDLAVACNHALQCSGFAAHPVEAYRYFVGDGVHNLILRAMPAGSGAAAVAAVEDGFRAYYAAHAQERTQPYPEIAETLAVIKAAGVRLAVLSNKPDAYVGELAERYFPGVFDVAYGQRDGVALKPDPTAVREILRELGAGAGESIYIGDTAVDMKTGKNAGLFTVGVLWGFRTREELVGSGADVTIDKCSALVKIALDK